MNTPVAWRCRTTEEPDWKYGESPLTKKDLFRKELGFEEQPLYARPTSPVTNGDRA